MDQLVDFLLNDKSELGSDSEFEVVVKVADEPFPWDQRESNYPKPLPPLTRNISKPSPVKPENLGIEKSPHSSLSPSLDSGSKGEGRTFTTTSTRQWNTTKTKRSKRFVMPSAPTIYKYCDRNPFSCLSRLKSLSRTRSNSPSSWNTARSNLKTQYRVRRPLDVSIFRDANIYSPLRDMGSSPLQVRDSSLKRKRLDYTGNLVLYSRDPSLALKRLNASGKKRLKKRNRGKICSSKPAEKDLRFQAIDGKAPAIPDQEIDAQSLTRLEKSKIPLGPRISEIKRQLGIAHDQLKVHSPDQSLESLFEKEFTAQQSNGDFITKNAIKPEQGSKVNLIKQKLAQKSVYSREKAADDSLKDKNYPQVSDIKTKLGIEQGPNEEPELLKKSDKTREKTRSPLIPSIKKNLGLDELQDESLGAEVTRPQKYQSKVPSKATSVDYNKAMPYKSAGERDTIDSRTVIEKANLDQNGADTMDISGPKEISHISTTKGELGPEFPSKIPKRSRHQDIQGDYGGKPESAKSRSPKGETSDGDSGTLRPPLTTRIPVRTRTKKDYFKDSRDDISLDENKQDLVEAIQASKDLEAQVNKQDLAETIQASRDLEARVKVTDQDTKSHPDTAITGKKAVDSSSLKSPQSINDMIGAIPRKLDSSKEGSRGPETKSPLGSTEKISQKYDLGTKSLNRIAEEGVDLNSSEEAIGYPGIPLHRRSHFEETDGIEPKILKKEGTESKFKPKVVKPKIFEARDTGSKFGPKGAGESKILETKGTKSAFKPEIVESKILGTDTTKPGFKPTIQKQGLEEAESRPRKISDSFPPKKVLVDNEDSLMKNEKPSQLLEDEPEALKKKAHKRGEAEESSNISYQAGIGLKTDNQTPSLYSGIIEEKTEDDLGEINKLKKEMLKQKDFPNLQADHVHKKPTDLGDKGEGHVEHLQRPKAEFPLVSKGKSQKLQTKEEQEGGGREELSVKTRDNNIDSLIRGMSDDSRSKFWIKNCYKRGSSPSAIYEKYSSLCDNNSPEIKTIEDDVNDTYLSDNEKDRVVRLLNAYLILDPNVEYSSNLIPIVARFASILDDERDAFYVFNCFMTVYEQRISRVAGLEGSRCQMYQFDCLLEEHLPELYEHLRDIGVNTEPFVTSCIQDVFQDKFDEPTILTTYDWLFLDGKTAPFKISLGHLKIESEQIFKTRDPRKVHDILKRPTKPSSDERRELYNISADFNITDEDLDQLADRFYDNHVESLDIIEASKLSRIRADRDSLAHSMKRLQDIAKMAFERNVKLTQRAKEQDALILELQRQIHNFTLLQNQHKCPYCSQNKK